MLNLFKDRNFFLFWIGECVSVIGDHISIIAFPWLILKMTGSAAMTGFVLAVQGIPRAVLMLWGGAIVDRYSPRGVMVNTNIIRLLLVVVLGFLLLYDSINVIGVFALAAAFGIADAFFYPATTSFLPSIVEEKDLQSGNAIVQSTNQLAIIFGPMIAGLIIAGEISVAGHGDASAIQSSFETDRIGLARAFFADAGTFALSILTLSLVKVRSLKEDKDPSDASGNFLDEFKKAIAFIWSIPAFKLCFIAIAILNFFYMAPVFVGLPVLADMRYANGSFVYGIIVGAYGIGALVGGITAGMSTPIAPENIARTMFFIFAYSGLCLGLVALSESYLLAMFFFITAGLGDSFIWVHFMAWLQKVTPDHMMGRVMSLLMLLAIGLLPVANAVMGLLFEWNIIASMMGASLFIIISCLITALHPDAKRVTATP
ncbi:MFS transporter [Kordiimonas sp. SCSIO 12610]|uniref:MFS transporter n=1 Tax=Kordiimonas sp. SCSIO 12610 TaxID=2829597 RepID=UPI0021099F42|nr:MFS transporter [Kordiimonas sp. SCSIO 12610]UTW55620.1 MFS transporter [Kordiimonas sp. SCSIO 12610]